MKYTIFAYEMIRITKRCVTFNIYARNFNFHNEMKATITITLSKKQFSVRPFFVL